MGKLIAFIVLSLFVFHILIWDIEKIQVNILILNKAVELPSGRSQSPALKYAFGH